MAEFVKSSASGDRLAALRAGRDFLARAIEDCDSKRDLAALYGKWQATLAEIAVIEARQPKGDVVDEIAERRAARRAGAAKGSSRAERAQ